MCVQLRSLIYSEQKLGNRVDECEDAASVCEPHDGMLTTEPACYALADGATTGAFSREWAEWLTRDLKQYCTSGESFVQRANRLRSTWSKHFDALELPWYAKAKAQKGAFATLLGFWLMPMQAGDQTGVWEATAVGDTCLFHIRGNDLVQAFPVLNSTSFGSTPDLLSSKSFHANSHEEHTQGTWLSGDRFLLMTDALAAWFLRCYEDGRQPWHEIEMWNNKHVVEALSFASWIDHLRTADHLRNDDVTLLIIEVNQL